MPLGYCKVRVNITALVKDGNDSDIAPDEQALSGQLKLVPMVKPGTPLQYDDGGRKKLKVLTALENIEIGPFGDIVNGAVDFVTVPAPDASNTNIAALQWQAIFVNPKYGNKIVQINDIFFWAVAGVDIDLADQVNTAPSSTAVQITRGPRGFGVVDVQTEADELVFFAGPQDDPDAWLEAGRALLPAGGGLTVEQIAAAAGDAETALGQVLANSYTPVLTADSSRPGLYFFSGAVATDGALAAASSYYKSAALASGSTRLKLLTLGDSTNDGFGSPGGPSSWAKVWPQRLAELLRSQLGRPAGGRGWIPPSPPVGPGSYSFNTAQQLPAGRTLDTLNVPTFQTGIPGSLWLQRGHASNADEVLYTLSPGVTAVDVLTTGYSGNMIITAANAGSSITKSSVGDRIVTRITDPGATVSIRGDVGVGLAILGIIEHVGDDGAGVTQVNLSQASIRAFEVAGWLSESDKSTLPLIDAYDPHVALITLGSNDKSTGRTQAQMSSAMTTIVERLRSASAQMEIVFIVRPDPDTAWTAYGNNIISTAATLGVRSLDLRGQLSSSSLYVADGVHFNEAGEDAMADLLLDYMKVGA
ncbi:hypothetical protein CH274_13125 [Rhodococcus sp. 06-418-5]|uniref:SGNH/GDSL hydrolase family protein n=1 Tax=Rhodococcus sp. 06-418-5 TaxID=2022507 RepID=UPI000B9C163C|nr:GDSL-type esterase/lipase family protein [Rhodococcus sp. 06-418-5]OZC80173.1 hypothetical protein CH274_13125 [Rhodococcus sp. 06-418-5]